MFYNGKATLNPYGSIASFEMHTFFQGIVRLGSIAFSNTAPNETSTFGRQTRGSSAHARSGNLGKNMSIILYRKRNKIFFLQYINYFQ